METRKLSPLAFAMRSARLNPRPKKPPISAAARARALARIGMTYAEVRVQDATAARVYHNRLKSIERRLRALEENPGACP